MENNLSNSKRIAKNTLLLYFRMLFMMAVSLYTSRVVLNVLGVENYGIYNVVGGIIVVLSFLNSSMAGATQRFLNVQLGMKNESQLKNTFSTAVVIHLVLALLILILSEIIGVWFLNNYLNIDAGRINAANWVFQFSVASFLLSICSVPFNACIIAHERMSAFAYISILEALMKLFFVYLLQFISYDKLILYAFFMMVVSVATCLSYVLFALRHFAECRLTSLRVEKKMMKDMVGFSGWTVFGSLGSISHTQGIAIVINMFFGATLNAAQGIANQVTGIVNQFVSNFMTALNPQIVKNYAAGDYLNLHLLVKRGSRMGICLVAFFAIPLVFEIPMILNLWLGTVPDYTVKFVRIILLTSLCNAFASPLAAAQGATGNIRTYQIILTSIGWLHLPLAWVFFRFGYEPYYAMYVYFFLVIVMQIIRIHIVCKSIKMSRWSFYFDVVLRCLWAVMFSSILPGILHFSLRLSIWNSIVVILAGFVSVIIACYFIVVTKEEKKILGTTILSKLGRFR